MKTTTPTQKKQPRFDSERWLWDEARKAALEWTREQCADPYAALYLYFSIGSLTIGRNCPASMELANGERLGPAGTTDQMMHRIYNLARRLPCLPPEAWTP